MLSVCFASSPVRDPHEITGEVLGVSVVRGGLNEMQEAFAVNDADALSVSLKKCIGRHDHTMLWIRRARRLKPTKGLVATCPFRCHLNQLSRDGARYLLE